MFGGHRFGVHNRLEQFKPFATVCNQLQPFAIICNHVQPFATVRERPSWQTVGVPMGGSAREVIFGGFQRCLVAFAC